MTNGSVPPPMPCSPWHEGFPCWQDISGTEYVQAAVDTALDIHTSQPEGDILMFLTGQGEIEQVRRVASGEGEALMLGSTVA